MFSRPSGTISDVDSEFGKRLKYARELRKLGTNELGTKVGVGDGVISKYEGGSRGKNMGADELLGLADVLQVSPFWLRYGRGPMVTQDIGKPDPYPNRIKAITEARARGYDEMDIQYVRDLPGFSSKIDPDESWWLRRIENQRDVREGLATTEERPALNPSEKEEEFSPRPSRGRNKSGKVKKTDAINIRQPTAGRRERRND